MSEKHPGRENGSQEEPSEKGGFARQLGLISTLAIGLGTMLGAGLFVLAPQAAAEAGPGVTFTYLLAGLIVLPSAMVVSELATAMPQEGGSYHLISRTLGPLAAAIVGPANWLGLTFATGFYLIGFTRFFSALWEVPDIIVIFVVGAAFTYLNYRGAHATGMAQNVIVAAVVVILLLFIARGIFNVERELQTPFLPAGWGAVLSAIGLVIVSFTGFEKVSSVAEEIKKPGRNLPRAIIGSVLIATLLYAGTVFIMTGVIQRETLTGVERPLVTAGEVVWGGFGTIMLIAGGLLATASSANAAIMASSRINFAMGRDRILPQWFGALNHAHRTPHRAIFITGGAAILLALTGAAEVLAEIGSALFMISYALMAGSLLLMRSTRPDWYRPAYRVPLYPWLPLAGGLAALAVIFTMEPLSQISGLGLAGISLIFYFAWGRKHNRIDSQLQRVLAHEQPGDLLRRAISPRAAAAKGEKEPAGREILVAAGQVEAAARLAEIASLIARGRGDTGLRLVKVLTVPQTVAKKYAEEHFSEEELDPGNLLHDLHRRFSDSGIPVNTESVIARNVTGGIIQSAEENERTDLILLGYSGDRKDGAEHGRVDKEIGTAARLPVAVLIARQLKELKRVIVAGGEDEHARLALSLGRDIQRASGAELVVFHRGADPDSPQPAFIRDILGEDHENVTIRPLRREPSADDLRSDVTPGCDLIVVGSSGNWSAADIVFGRLSDKIARTAECPVLVVHQGQGERTGN